MLGEFMDTEKQEKLLAFWLFISAFGIMFAVISWLQEIALFPPSSEIGFWKGFSAVVSGTLLYILVARNIPGGPADK
tara:strand:- start:45 stop:275 length:231 start_codon:yes stop_codon:yes gene_type:complete